MRSGESKDARSRFDERGDTKTAVRWTTIADALGAVLHQRIAWGLIIEAGVRSGRGTGEETSWDASPDAGELPAHEIDALATVLAERTATRIALARLADVLQQPPGALVA